MILKFKTFNRGGGYNNYPLTQADCDFCPNDSGNLLSGLLRRKKRRLALNGHGSASALCSACSPRNDECYYAKPNMESGLPPHLTHLKKAAFTLAEVLVTLGVIGIVAAMTIPTLVNNYKTQVNVVRIKKFYSMFNQAIRLVEVDNGSIDNWFLECGLSSAPTCTIDEVEDWYNNYLGKYIKTTKVEKDSQSTPNRLYLHLADGCVVIIYANIRDVSLMCFQEKTSSSFIFNGYSPNSAFWSHCSKYLDTYCYGWDGTREGLIEGRNYQHAAAKNNSAYCVKLLQYDGWVVKDDNPCKYY